MKTVNERGLRFDWYNLNKSEKIRLYVYCVKYMETSFMK